MSMIPYLSPFDPGVILYYDDSVQPNLGGAFGAGSPKPTDDSREKVAKAIQDIAGPLAASQLKEQTLHMIWGMFPLDIPATDLPTLEIRGRIVQGERAEISYQSAIYIYEASLRNWLLEEPSLAALHLEIPPFPQPPALPNYSLKA
jgi:hypothetical protein